MIEYLKNKKLNKMLSYFKDKDIDEIMLNSNRSTVIIKKFAKYKYPPFFLKIEDMQEWLQDFSFSLGYRLDPNFPSNGGIIKNTNFRWHAVITPVTDGPIFTIRRNRFFDIELKNFKISKFFLNKIQNAISKDHPIIIFGPTGSGKSTFLASLLKTYLLDERVFILESIKELPAISDYHINFLYKPPDYNNKNEFSLNEILNECLRLRPDRFVIGEVRMGSSKAMFESLISAHKAMWTTIHANSPKQAIDRLIWLGSIDGNKKDFILSILKEYNPYFIGIERAFPPRLNQIASATEIIDNLNL